VAARLSEGRLLYSATMSADGFIAGAGGDLSWLARFLGSGDMAAAALPRMTGSLLVGRRTYGVYDSESGASEGEGEPFGGGWEGEQFVVTHDPPAAAPLGIHFHDDLGEAIAAAKVAAGERYVNVLGAEVARSCLELGLLDEVLVVVAPILLGDGVRLFDHPGGTEVMLERTAVEVEPTATWIWFKVLG
jgi:dihydrofolate reductase